MRLAQISDLHVQVPDSPERRLFGGDFDTVAGLRATVDALNALDPAPDAVVVTGDIAALEGWTGDYEAARAGLDRLRAPWFPLPGNHDTRDGMRTAFGDLGLFTSGEHLSFRVDVGDAVLIGVDSLDPGRVEGRLCADRLAWVDGEIGAAGDRPVVVALHHPPFLTGSGFGDTIGAVGGDDLAGILRRRGTVRGVLCGHLHRTIVRRFADGIGFVAPAACRQGWVLPAPGRAHRWTDEPAGFVLHTLEDGDLVSFVLPVEAVPG